MSVGIGDYNFVDRAKEMPELARALSTGMMPDEQHSSPAGDDTISPTDRQREDQVTSLARQMSRASIHGDQPLDLFNYNADSDLDPFSDNFNARKWVKEMSRISQESSPRRTAGISYSGMSVHGFGSDADYQKTVSNIGLSLLSSARDQFSNRKRKVHILNDLDGVLDAGEMLVVLGPPGSGCTTLLKTIAGETNGIFLNDEAEINYRGITPKQMHGRFRGEAIYTAEVDVHFPGMTVGETLQFAAEARAPRSPPGGLSRIQWATHYRDVIMSVFGITHTINTKVGNDFIRGVSGGERKRVTISEAALAGAPLQCWDNSTRGLDSANAIEFCKTLRMQAEYLGTTAVVAIYQSPQSAYDLFDKVSVLYEGEQIYFGKIHEAKPFFEDMGFECPAQQTTPDFLTSLTSPSERKARPGFENRVPNTPKEFVHRWKQSAAYDKLREDIALFNQQHPVGGQNYEDFVISRRAQQSKRTRASSPYTLSYGQQVKLCVARGFWRLRADPSLTYTQLFGNFVMGLIISSVFYNLQDTTDSFYQRGSLLFFAVLLNAFGAALEILTLYAQRPIVEKHARYAFYHPSAEAFASMLVDMPYKVLNAIFFNLVLYFMTNLRRAPGPFFFYLMINFFATLTMSMIFRTIGSVSRQFVAAMTPASIIMIGLVVYTGFAIPVTYMRGWSRWINYIDPIAYAFESLMINEFHGRDFSCSSFVPSPLIPGYADVGATNRVCSTVGSVAGASSVNGDTYLAVSYAYYHSHKWRNFGILLLFMFFFFATYIGATEYITEKQSKGEILVYPKGQIPEALRSSKSSDAESEGSDSNNRVKSSSDGVNTAIIQRQTSIFSWRDVVYDIKIKKETRRILNHVDGWVKPGTLTALMGVSGAGKTTLLDVLATRVTMGVVTGEMLVDGHQRDVSFQRKTGYVQQQDIHLQTSTVREALRFSALLRQPKHVSKQEKLQYVEEVLKLLEMDGYADAVVGVPGEGLNVEQRKRLTIGVELVAKPELLLFLDEPTSGLDSQTSWNILQLLRKLTENGQAILCTIHQPSAILFENFDRLLFLAKGGKTVYFGEVGKGSHILIDYFTRNGAPECPPGENPAEWMLAAIGAAPGTHTDVDWHQQWVNSPERVRVHEELDRMKQERPAAKEHSGDSKADKASYSEFAAPFGTQFVVVLKRVFEQYWRTPSYIYSKLFLATASALFIGFSFFKADTSQQGLQSQLFSAFMSFLIFGQLVQQIMPNFVVQRSLYESRERPSKTYDWKVFILSNIVVEIPWSMLVGTLFFFCWYYPIGYYRNAVPTNTVHVRGALMWLYMQVFFLFTSTFATAIVAGMDLAETAGNIAQLMFSLCLIFNGVLVVYNSLPGFWKFMYRVSPFTYLVEGLLSVAVANTAVVCSSAEYLRFEPPNGETCGTYMSSYRSIAGGYLLDENAQSNCQYCAIDSTNTFLSNFNIQYAHRWRNFGLMWVYIIVNVIAAIGFYWLIRVPKKAGKEKPTTERENLKAISREKSRETGRVST
ncbi:uncharacterized protein IL334_001383 [Kwoniella shivajii]|uniref:ABC transporter domain-containing protein n=1 Tax=Kwoniella shivajii TaxID=564305 RepID=A0ABZ1CRS8_9TREE|nr:hypothetical protein IL334_001383 [Kwoniella shivajii]